MNITQRNVGEGQSDRARSPLADEMKLGKSDRTARDAEQAKGKMESAHVQVFRSFILVALQSHSQRAAALQKVFLEWTERDTGAAVAWVKGISSSVGRQDAFAALAPMLAWSDPRAAAELLTALPPGNNHDAALTSVVSHW